LRRLTLNEVKRLQGFPDDWVISGNKAEVFKQIGNAVPTIFGEVLAATIMQHLSEKNNKKCVRLGFPEEFWKYIDYTVRDHERNKAARKIHQNFEK
jgi:DNA (cytosine-5)-methyltransferase 1